MGWLPDQYFNASPYEFYCAAEGFLQKQKTQAKMLRIASYRIHQSLVEKPLKIEEFWPIDEVKQEVQEELIMPETLIEEVLKYHNITTEK